jgi:hypothetical protein
VKRAWHFEKDIFICHFDITWNQASNIHTHIGQIF